MSWPLYKNRQEVVEKLSEGLRDKGFEPLPEDLALIEIYASALWDTHEAVSKELKENKLITEPFDVSHGTRYKD